MPERELRGFLFRLLGWGDADAVESAFQAVVLAAEHRTVLVLRGAGDLVPIARTLHRLTFGASRPFIVSDPHRGDVAASVRSPANCASGVGGFMKAERGTLCVRATRLPRDFPMLLALLRTTTDDVAFTVCTDEKEANSPFLARPAPVVVPPLLDRRDEIRRIVSEYAQDAISDLGAPPGSFTSQDMTWVLENGSSSLADIEKSTLRVVALRTSRNVAHAARRLGMTHVALLRWIGRRKLPPAPAEPLPAPRLSLQAEVPV